MFPIPLMFATILALTNNCGVVSVDTHGARVVSYVPAGGEEVFFVSETGTGGMPLCWPWFAGLGPREDSPRHGIARYRDFEVAGTSRTENDTTLTLRLKSDTATRAQFPHDFDLTFSVRLNDRLTVSMTAENTGKDPFPVTEAFHPYFAVSDSGNCQIPDLDAPEYRLEDSISGRRLVFTDEGGKDRRVWKPGSQGHLSKTVSSLAPDDWRKFICVENGTLKSGSAYVLKPGERHTLVRTIRLLPPNEADCERWCAESFLTDGERQSSWSAVYNFLFDLDAAADDAWCAVRTPAAFDARRKELRARMIERIGGFPEERTPLNAKVTGVTARDGYRIENILFESRPGAFVTGNLYLPATSRFSPPYPAAIEVCGHAPQGKNGPKYQRIAIMAARNGLAAFVVDPLDQGERCQWRKGLDTNPTRSHLRLGVNAMLLGHGLAAFEMWDAMRALDYLDSRNDLRHDGYGSFGNSGGGTQSVMLSALDDRIVATATSSFLSNLREQTAWRLLADSEQLIFSQLADGLNHAAYALLGGNPVLMLARRDEMIPFTGTRETFRVLTAVATNLGREGWYTLYDLPGPHGYCERNMRKSVAFLVERLRGGTADFSDMGEDRGPELGHSFVTPSGHVMDLPGFKSAYAYLEDELEAALAVRKPFTLLERAALVRRLADIDEGRVGAREVFAEKKFGEVRAVRAIYEADGGYRVPVVELVPVNVKGAPVLLVGDDFRSNRLAAARGLLKKGHPVMLADVIATGEIGATRHHYNNPNDDEETAKMLYLVGSSLVGRRAGEIIALARDLGSRYGGRVAVVAHGRTAVAAAHAYAAAPDVFDDVETVDAPPSWAESVRARAMCDYAVAVHGALLHYDWTDLAPQPAERRSDIQARIDSCSACGGGVVSVEPGEYEDVKPIILKSNVELHLEEGVVLHATTNRAAYAHMPGWNRGAFITAIDATNISVTGSGRIECSGDRVPLAKRQPDRWRGIHFLRCRDVRLFGFTLANTYSWGCYLQECDGVSVKGLTIRNHANHNNDGLDIASRNVEVEDCDIDSEDDALVLKNHNPDFVVENVRVRNCRLASNSRFIKIGTETWGGFRNIEVSDCELDCRTRVSKRHPYTDVPGLETQHTGAAGLSVLVVDGGFAENIRYSRIRMKRGVMTPIWVRLDCRNPRADGKPTYIRNVVIEDVEMELPSTSFIASAITGAAGLRPSDIVLRRMRLKTKALGDMSVVSAPVQERVGTYPSCRQLKHALPAAGFYLRHADRVTFEDVIVEPDGKDVRKTIFAEDSSWKEQNGYDQWR